MWQGRGGARVPRFSPRMRGFFLTQRPPRAQRDSRFENVRKCEGGNVRRWECEKVVLELEAWVVVASPRPPR